jgi:hypothetical protein
MAQNGHDLDPGVATVVQVAGGEAHSLALTGAVPCPSSCIRVQIRRAASPSASEEEGKLGLRALSLDSHIRRPRRHKLALLPVPGLVQNHGNVG